MKTDLGERAGRGLAICIVGFLALTACSSGDEQTAEPAEPTSVEETDNSGGGATTPTPTPAEETAATDGDSQDTGETAAPGTISFTSNDQSAFPGSRAVLTATDISNGEVHLLAVSADESGALDQLELKPGTYQLATDGAQVSATGSYSVTSINPSEVTVEPSGEVAVDIALEVQRSSFDFVLDGIDSTSVLLSWNPLGETAIEEFVVMRTFGQIPATGRDDGDVVASGGSSNLSITVDGNRADTQYTFTMFASDGSADLEPRSLTVTTAPAVFGGASYVYAPNTLLPTDFAALDAQRVGENHVRLSLSGPVEQGSSTEIPGMDQGQTAGCVVGLPVVVSSEVAGEDGFWGLIESCESQPLGIRSQGGDGAAAAVVNTDVPLTAVIPYIHIKQSGIGPCFNADGVEDPAACYSWNDDIQKFTAEQFAHVPEPEAPDLESLIPDLDDVQEPVDLTRGAIQVTLLWASPDDLDLEVIDGEGTAHNHNNPVSASGGKLDRDDLGDNSCTEVADRAENIVWATGGPPGTYSVSVTNFSNESRDVCTESPEARVIVRVDGEIVVDKKITVGADEAISFDVSSVSMALGSCTENDEGVITRCPIGEWWDGLKVPQTLEVQPDGTLLIGEFGSESAGLGRSWPPGGGTPIGRVDGRGSPTAIALGPENSFYMGTPEDLYYWSPGDQTQQHLLTGAYIHGVARFSEGNQLLVSASKSKLEWPKLYMVNLDGWTADMGPITGLLETDNRQTPPGPLGIAEVGWNWVNPTAVQAGLDGEVYASFEGAEYTIVRFSLDADTGALTETPAFRTFYQPGTDYVQSPKGFAVDAEASIYIVDAQNHHVVRWVTKDADGLGSSAEFVHGTTEESGPRVDQLNQPFDVALDGKGNLFIADFGNARILKVWVGRPEVPPAEPDADAEVEDAAESGDAAELTGAAESAGFIEPAASLPSPAVPSKAGQVTPTFECETSGTANIEPGFGMTPIHDIDIEMKGASIVWDMKIGLEVHVDPKVKISAEASCTASLPSASVQITTVPVPVNLEMTPVIEGSAEGTFEIAGPKLSMSFGFDSEGKGSLGGADHETKPFAEFSSGPIRGEGGVEFSLGIGIDVQLAIGFDNALATLKGGFEIGMRPAKATIGLKLGAAARDLSNGWTLSMLATEDVPALYRVEQAYPLSMLSQKDFMERNPNCDINAATCNLFCPKIGEQNVGVLATRGGGEANADMFGNRRCNDALCLDGPEGGGLLVWTGASKVGQHVFDNCKNVQCLVPFGPDLGSKMTWTIPAPNASDEEYNAHRHNFERTVCPPPGVEPGVVQPISCFEVKLGAEVSVSLIAEAMVLFWGDKESFELLTGEVDYPDAEFTLGSCPDD